MAEASFAESAPISGWEPLLPSFFMQLTCFVCKQPFDVENPRPREWTGKIRTTVPCPHCGHRLQHPSCPRGVASTRSRVDLLAVGDRECSLEDYETSTEVAQAFAETFKRAWQRIPERVRDTIINHWVALNDTPHVWLVDRRDWGGNGWAANVAGWTLALLPGTNGVVRPR